MATSSTPKNKAEYVLFDMDGEFSWTSSTVFIVDTFFIICAGLMIDSESIYTVATNEALAKYGELEMTWDIKAGCMGKPEREATMHLLSFFPNVDINIDDFIRERTAIQDKLWPSVPLLPGVQKFVHHLKKHGVPMAVATSSRRRNFEIKTSRLQDVFDCFDGKIICGDDKQYEMAGKPAPDIFLTAASVFLKRNVGSPRSLTSQEQWEERAKGLVFEDALAGMQAGKRAGMSVVWIPDPNLVKLGTVVDEVPDQVIQSMEDFKPEEWGLPPYDQ